MACNLWHVKFISCALRVHSSLATFLRVNESPRELYRGLALCWSASPTAASDASDSSSCVCVEFDCAHLMRARVPSQLAYLSGLLDMFKEKIVRLRIWFSLHELSRNLPTQLHSVQCTVQCTVHSSLHRVYIQKLYSIEHCESFGTSGIHQHFPLLLVDQLPRLHTSQYEIHTVRVLLRVLPQ